MRDRGIKMIKRIRIEDLKPGMFIIDVRNSWSGLMGTEKAFYVEDENLIQKFRLKGFKEIYIDTLKKQDVKRKIKKAVKSAIKEIDLQSKLKNAAVIRKEIYKAVTSVMTDFMKSDKIILGKVQNIVSNVVDSVLSNKYIVVGLGMLQTNNNYVFEHAVNSLTLMVAFAHSLKYAPEKQKELGIGALLHDIGMLRIPSNILHKRGELSENEIIEMKKHVGYGYHILKDTPGIAESALLMASQHHERINGTGYPSQLKGNKISVYGQMAGIVDVYHAATSDRGYKKGVTPTKALADILMKRNTEFDVELVSKFIQAIGIYPFGTLLSLENGLVGLVVNIDEKDLLHPTMRIIYNHQKRGMIAPYDIYPNNYKKDEMFKIKGVRPMEKIFLKKSDISNILGVQH